MVFSSRRFERFGALVVLSCVLLSGCGTDEFHENYPPAAKPVGPAVDWTAPDLDASRAFADLETRLTAYGPVGVAFEVRASEPVPTKMRGLLRLEYGQKLHLEADGRMRGAEVAPAITSTEERTEGGTRQKGFDVETPSGLRDAVALGFTRMGILHNIVRLSVGALPDHADGGVASWVTTTNHRVAGVEKTAGGDVRALSFDILVDGKATGDATLLVDIHSGWPVRRVQTVRFPDGTMTVEETYRFF